MPHHRKPYSKFYKLQTPVHIWHNWKENKWILLDRMDTIIAENLTKEIAETLEQAVNYCGPAIAFTKLFVGSEHLVACIPDIPEEEILMRAEMFKQALAFLIELGVIEPPPKYIDGLPEWKDRLEKELLEAFNE